MIRSVTLYVLAARKLVPIFPPNSQFLKVVSKSGLSILSPSWRTDPETTVTF